MIFTETWLAPEKESLYNINGFRQFFKSNTSNRSGGVAIFVRDYIPAIAIDCGDVSDCDCVAVEINYGGGKVQVAVVYRSPTASVSDAAAFGAVSVPRIINKLDEHADCFLIGLCLIRPDNVTEEYIDNCYQAGFVPLNDRIPTRVTDSSARLIDHVFFRCYRGTKEHIEIMDPERVADHCLIILA